MHWTIVLSTGVDSERAHSTVATFKTRRAARARLDEIERRALALGQEPLRFTDAVCASGAIYSIMRAS